MGEVELKINIEQKINILLEYFLLTSVIALTGFEFFFRDSNLIYILGLFSLGIFILKGYKFTKKFFIFLLILFIILFLQKITFNTAPTNIITTIIRFIIYYLVATILKERFAIEFIKIIFYICISSIVLYFITKISFIYNFFISISSGITSLGVVSDTYDSWANPSQNIIFYVIPTKLVNRNNGPFWEPGMFAVFINIALVLNLIKTRKLFEYKNIIFIIASLTTLSTTSYITTFFILAYHFIFTTKKRFLILFLLLIPFIVIPVFNSDIVSGKINENMETLDDPASRMGAALIHLELIIRSPLIGYGYYANDAFENFFGELIVSPNGLTNVIRFFGIPFSIFYYILLFKGIRNSLFYFEDIRKIDILILYLVVLLVVFSQDVTTRHFYYVLIMLGLVNCNKVKNEYSETVNIFH